MAEAKEKKVADKKSSVENSKAADEAKTQKTKKADGPSEIKDEKKLTKLEQMKQDLAELQSKRTGYYVVDNFSFDDLRFVKNKMNKATWNGGNEAFIMTTVAYGLEQAANIYDPKKQKDGAESPGPIQLQAGVIEGSLYFLNRIESKGPKSAQDFIGVFFKLQNAMSKFTQLDEPIKALKGRIEQEENKQSSKEKSTSSSK